MTATQFSRRAVRRIAFLCALVMASPWPSAQTAGGPSIEFDLIIFNRLFLDKPPGGQFDPPLALLVNTGSVPLTFNDWTRGTILGHSSPAANDFAVGLSSPLGLASFSLAPGQAIGSNHPLLTALLQPGETLLTNQNLSVLSAQIKGVSPLTSVDMTLAVQAGERVAQTLTRVNFGPGQSFVFDPVSATRTSAVPATSSVELVGPGSTPSAGLSAMGQYNTAAPSTLAYGSTMPTLGNSTFGLALWYCIPPDKFTPCPQSPFLLLVSTGLASLTVKGCPIWVDLGPAITLAGTLGGGGFRFLPAPVPEDVALVGLSLAAQAAVLTHQAANGHFVTTNAVRLTFGDDWVH